MKIMIGENGESVMERKQYETIDLAKFIAAFFVIILHTAPFQSYSGALNYGFRNIVTVIAVPFFFTASGFLFFSKLNTLGQKEKKSYVLQYIKRLAVMYGLWSAVYFVFVAIGWVQNGVQFMDVLQYIKRFFFEGSYLTIWFLPALISSTLLVYLLSRKLSCKAVFWIAVPFYIVACLGSSYYELSMKLPVLREFFGLYYSFFDTVKNGVLFGFIYVALGAWLSTRQFQAKPIKYIVFIGIFWCLTAAETLIQTILGCSTMGVDTKLFLLPLSIFIFLLVMSVKLPKSGAYVWLRKLSLLMFLSQRIFLTLFEMFLQDTLFVKNTMVYFLCISALTLLFSFAFIKLSEKIKLLKWFY